MKRTVDMDDTLQENVDSAIEDVKGELLRYLEDNPDATSTPDMGNDLDYSGAINEIVDSSVPIYTKEIEDTWCLHGSELEEAYENAGVGDNPRGNDGMAAIYYYIYEKVAEWYRLNGDDIFEEWYANVQVAEAEQVLVEGMSADAGEDMTLEDWVDVREPVLRKEVESKPELNWDEVRKHVLRLMKWDVTKK